MSTLHLPRPQGPPCRFAETSKPAVFKTVPNTAMPVLLGRINGKVAHVVEFLGLGVGRPVPPVLGVGVHLALGQEELDGLEVALGGRLEAIV